MSKLLSHEQIEDFIDNVLDSPKRTHWKGDKIQFCCTVHGESHPSAGINADYTPKDPNTGEPIVGAHTQVFNCFSCGAHGSLPTLLFLSQPDEYNSIYDAAKFLEDRYDVEFSFNFDTDEFELTRYDDYVDKVQSAKRYELSRVELAPFKSGKETFKYFFDRGFTKETMKRFMIGRDLDNETVTMPIYWEDGVLAGIIGRYIDPRRPHNMRFKIYKFPKGTVTFPQDKLEVIDDTIIMIESMMDAMMLNQWGYTNAQSIMGMQPTREQLIWLAQRCKKLIFLLNPDEAGQKSLPLVKEVMREYGVLVLEVNYPDMNRYGKDPCEWGEALTIDVIASAHLMKNKLKRLE